MVHTWKAPDQVFKTQTLGYEQHWLAFMSEDSKKRSKGKMTAENIDGLVMFNIDPGTIDKVRVQVQHFSAVEREAIEDVIKLFTAYIWDNLPADDIRIGMLHFKDEKEKLVVDDEVKKLLKGQKYKWKTLINESNSRTLIMAAPRPKDFPCKNKRHDSNSEPIQVKSAALLAVKAGAKAGKAKNKAPSSSVFVPITEIGALLKLGEANAGTSLGDLNKENKDCDKKVCEWLKKAEDTEMKTMPVTHSVIDKSLDVVFADIKGQGIDMDTTAFSKLKDVEYVTAVTSFISRFKSLDLCKIKSHNFLRIKDEEIVIANSKDKTIDLAIVPTDDPQITFFMIQKPTIAPKDFPSASTSCADLVAYSRNHIEEMVVDESRKLKDLYVPGFKCEQNDQHLDQIAAFQLPDKKGVEHAALSVQFAINAIEPSDAGLQFEPDKKTSYLIERDFIFGLTHDTLEQDLKVFLTLGYISQKDWTK